MKILLPIDESWCSEDAVTEVGERAWGSDTTVRLLHVIERFAPPAADLWYDAGGSLDLARYELTERNEETIKRIADQLRQHGLYVETVVRNGNPAKVIVDEAYEWDADLIVLGTHGYSLLARLLLGSTAQSVIDHAPCSIEVVREKQLPD